jgi:hypothetical protein
MTEYVKVVSLKYIGSLKVMFAETALSLSLFFLCLSVCFYLYVLVFFLGLALILGQLYRNNVKCF